MSGWIDLPNENLELFYPNHPEGVPLIQIIDQTQTAMGARLLRQWMAFPLKELKLIEERQERVQDFLEETILLEHTEEALSKIIDIERVMAKVATEKISPRALNQLADSLEVLEYFKKVLMEGSAKHLKVELEKIPSPQEVLSLLKKTLHPEAPVVVSKGNVIAAGFSERLDELRRSKRYIAISFGRHAGTGNRTHPNSVP